MRACCGTSNGNRRRWNQRDYMCVWGGAGILIIDLAKTQIKYAL